MSFTRLVRFVPRGRQDIILIGEPLDPNIDVGEEVRSGNNVKVNVFSGTTVLDFGSATGTIESIDRILSPLAMTEVGTIRCIGLNYAKHAKEANLELPSVPVVFLKPATSLGDPWPAPTIIPKFSLVDDTADYESELCVVIGKTAKNVNEEDALSYVLGYTASNDISARKQQFEQSQWCFSKGFDTSCPIGPTIVSTSAIPDPSQLHIRGLKNGKVMQDSPLSDLIFSIPKLVSWLSQGTTLPAGTLILTGTPAGIGMAMEPTEYLHDGDEFAVKIWPHIGSLYSTIRMEH
ncbi:hypothetical protein N5P37_005609 [Trichoderma harzianum]|uniref:Fumarylacetoacetase-like C-terminal domain-containing protein n=1 Tax=Trichoderma harzianum CBS 226.95 TaxID=983964 RepID=A0A2T3ZSD8_TRIHA|nr:hypothetical protein M431DRAFT_525965 [Trichoderma harzianum CBS 226.95]KAK0762791.1 hypothetical protein N5P37_005609 [Trichoderma harzianum]PKK50310.1 hypothetical protein CI102_5310 [Trichoderma harzianum]PTB47712.1 hypothetical protein M431DRAFT_525965 [Trichoderma harzianum CBS 226.95]